MKTNIELAAFARNAAESGWVYWYGTTGKRCTKDLYNRKKVQYPSHYTSDRTTKYMKQIAENRMCSDCIGLPKAYMWDRGDGTQGYGINGMPDTSADGAYNLAKTKGNIGTIPEIPGVMLHMSAHAGVYLGNGLVAEARGFNYGVVITKLKDRPWLHWYYLPGLTYVNGDNAIVDEKKTTELKKGSNGEDIIKLQKNLIKLGYALPKYGADGDFGGETDTAIRQFQKDHGLTVDGIVGEKTLKAIEEELSKNNDGYIVVTGNTVNVRDASNTNGRILGIAKLGEKYMKLGAENGWYKIRTAKFDGWISGKYVKEVE